ncbi:hypothetical protein BCT06_03670 [Vibrio breoganii]|uniref:hypothetical protein n=1 Tax=Vibrio breoganii TaxID=553239 RepID=UPI000C841C86|nr:hypothetical protein [Vibrio breoganii]PMO56413.1 hypothetical protein BCT06_03670 [Vibrio breoganii]
MEVSKTALAVALSTGLLFGCDFDVGPDSGGDSGTNPATPTSDLVGPLWNFEDASGASAQAIGLPNVYVFDGTNLKYYDDDATPNTYKITLTPYTDDAEAGEIEFTYYDESGTGSPVSGTYTVENGVLTVDTASEGVLIGADDTTNADIKAAVDAANADAGFNNYVQIIDTSESDTGELRLKLSDNDLEPITSGRLTLDLTHQLDEDSVGDANSKNAYVSFYASGTSTSNMHGEIALEAGKIKYRDNNEDLIEIVGSYTEGEELKIEANWDDGVFNFKVNDVQHSYASNEIPENGPVEVISVRLGDNSSTNNYEVLADNLEVYSNDSGSETLVFGDNFDSYAVGTVLNTKPYNSYSSEAVVRGDTPPPPAPLPTENQVAAITDQDETDTGELRYKFDSGMTTGTHKVSMYYDANETESAYVSLFDQANSTSSLIGELKIDEGKITLRGEATWEASFVPGTWIDLEMSWDTSSVDSVGSYTVKINGVDQGSFNSQNVTPGVEVTATTIKFSSNAGTAATTLYVDDYAVYSDVAATTELFSDDYESYSVGADLNTSGSYNSSTFSAVVAEDPLNQ